MCSLQRFLKITDLCSNKSSNIKHHISDQVRILHLEVQTLFIKLIFDDLEYYIIGFFSLVSKDIVQKWLLSLFFMYKFIHFLNSIVFNNIQGQKILLSIGGIILKNLNNSYFQAAYSACIFFVKLLEKNFFSTL